MKNSSLAMALLGVALICVGCASVVKSSKLDLTKDNAPIAISKGGYYFLPKVKVRLEGERRILSPNQEREESVSTEKQIVKDEKAKASTESTTEKNLKKSISKWSGQAQAEVEKTACTLVLKETFVEPDPDYFYSLDHLRDYFADDKVTVTFNPNGLLTKIDISAEDKTGEFITKIAELAKESAKAFAALAPMAEQGPPPFYFSLVVDPADEADIKRVNDQLNDLTCPIAVSSRSLYAGLTKVSPAQAGSRNGVYFRPALPYALTFESKGKINGFKKVENTLYLPNKAPVMFLDFERVAFGKYTHVVDFENGLLKQVNFSVPSSALGFMAIPIEIAKAIASIPGEIVQLKFNVVSKEKDLLSKQAELIDSQKKRLEAEEALRKYMEDLRKAKPDSQQDSGS